MIKKDPKTPISPQLAKAFVDSARKTHHDPGHVEVDQATDPQESISTGDTVGEILDNRGVYVKAWVWVKASDLSEEDQIKYFGEAVD